MNRLRTRLVFLTVLGIGALFYFWPLFRAPRLAYSSTPAGYYGLLTAGFRSGHLWVALDPPAALAQLPDPYDPVANASFRAHDMTYFHGKYYLYFGPTPVLLFFWPVVFVTGIYPSETLAVAVFLFGAFLVSGLLLRSIQQRYLPAAPAWIFGLALLCCGGATPAIFLTQGPHFYQVPIACAYLLQMVLLACLYRALHGPARLAGWLAAASLTYGFSVGARPDYLFSGGAIMLVLGWELRKRRNGGVPIFSAANIPLIAAAISPAAFCGAAILWYNYARFGSVAEFGVRFQLAAMRQVDFPTLSWKNILPHLDAYLIGPGGWSTTFPYFRPHSTYLPGVVRYNAFLWLIPFAFVRGSALGTNVAPPRRFIFLASYVALANLLLLSAFFGLTERYPPDFMGALLLLAAIAGLMVSVRYSRVGAVAVLVVGLWSLFVQAALFGQGLVLEGTWLNIGRAWSYPVYWAQRWRGEQFGALRLDLERPAFRDHAVEPLLETGSEADQRDWLQIEYLTATQVRLGFFHAGSGLLAGEEFALPVHRRAILVAEFGSLLPPYTSPLFAHVDPRGYAYNARRLSVTVDGVERLRGVVDCYPSSPSELSVGALRWATGGCAQFFTGKILSRSRAPLVLEAAPEEVLARALPVELALRFPAGKSSGQDPILLTGKGTKSDLLYVIYTGLGELRFAFDHYGNGGPQSETIPYDAQREQSLRVWMGSLAAGAPTPPGATSARQLMVEFDGRVLFNSPQNFFPATAGQSLLGANPSHPSTAGRNFSGEIRIVKTVPFSDLPESSRVNVYGTADLVLTFPRHVMQTSEPLAATGGAGEGDFLYVYYNDSTHVTFGYDHWGVGGFKSAPVLVDYATPHRVELVMESLLAPSTLAPRPRQVSVRLDGVTVLEGNSPCYPAVPSTIYLLENPLGGSTCGPAFAGQILAVTRR